MSRGDRPEECLFRFVVEEVPGESLRKIRGEQRFFPQEVLLAQDADRLLVGLEAGQEIRELQSEEREPARAREC